MKGWKTIALSVATIGLGILQSAEVTNLVAEHAGAVTIVVGILIAAFRIITTSAVFKGE